LLQAGRLETTKAPPAHRRLAVGLACLLAAALLTLWAPSRWALAAVQIGLCLFAGLWLAAMVRDATRVRLDALLVPLALAAAWGWLQLLAGQTVYRWATEQAALDWCFRLIAFFLALQLYREEALRRKLLAGLLWFGFAVSVTASLQRFTAPDRIFWWFDTGGIRGVMSPFVYYNQYAAFIETVLPLALAAALTERPRVWLHGTMAAVMIASVVASQSRAGAVLVALETLAVFALSGRRIRAARSHLVQAVAGTVLLALAFAAVLGWGPLWEKLRRADPWGERRLLTLSSIEMALDRPWLGCGLGTWPVAYPAYARFDDGLFDNQAHNDWAQWAAEGGLPFFLLMVAFAALLARRALASVWGLGLVAVLAHCLVDYHFQQRPAFGYYFFALAGVLAAERREGRNGL
jgi:O-antigen ligase